MKLLLKLGFLGTAYAGYQVQNNAETVQGKLNEATEKVFGFPCDIVGCSRTDSGVHARCFYATVAGRGQSDLSTTVPLDKIPTALNCMLPGDISVYEARWVGADFHARYSVRSKEYEYLIWNGSQKNPFLADRACLRQRPVTEKQLRDMEKAAHLMIGKHDFSSFMAAGSKITDPVRTVFDADVRREGDMIVFRVSADGFLYHMVRIMAGTLLEVADGKRAPMDITALIEAKDRTAAGPTAPAGGLYLNQVNYNKEDLTDA